MWSGVVFSFFPFALLVLQELRSFCGILFGHDGGGAGCASAGDVVDYHQTRRLWLIMACLHVVVGDECMVGVQSDNYQDQETWMGLERREEYTTVDVFFDCRNRDNILPKTSQRKPIPILPTSLVK